MVNIRVRHASRLIVAGALATLLAISNFGQSTGAIQGTVVDSSSSPIPNAKVTIKEQGTNTERTLTTDSAGVYFSPSLPAGTYQVEVTAPGMGTMDISGLVV